MGSQKLTIRQARTPRIATLRVTPELMRSKGASDLDDAKARRSQRKACGKVGDPIGGEQFHRISEKTEGGHEAPQRGGIE